MRACPIWEESHFLSYRSFKAQAERFFDLQERFKSGSLTQKQFRAFGSENRIFGSLKVHNQVKNDVLLLLEQFPAEEVFRQKSVCDDSDITPVNPKATLLFNPTPDTQLPEQFH